LKGNPAKREDTFEKKHDEIAEDGPHREGRATRLTGEYLSKWGEDREKRRRTPKDMRLKRRYYGKTTGRPLGEKKGTLSLKETKENYLRRNPAPKHSDWGDEGGCSISRAST